MIITTDEFKVMQGLAPNEEKKISLDFKTKEVSVKRCGDIIIVEDTYKIDLKTKIKENFCYQLTKDGLEPISYFSQSTNLYYKLVPTSDWPTIALGSVPMHRVKSPKQDTLNKISFLKPYGFILDTCMGLGYTAITASKKGKKVITFERDEIVYEIAQLNPYSKELFSSLNIEISQQDITKNIESFDDDYFDCIIHDPPTFKLSPELYSSRFYKELLRILKPKGKLFHYTPFYKVKKGYDFPSKIKGNLKEVGFKNIRFSDKASGLLCQK